MSKENKQKLHTTLYQLFQMTGSLVEMKQVERLRTLSLQLSNVLSDLAREESVELMRKLQQAVSTGFEKTFAAHADLEKRIKVLEEKAGVTVPNRSRKRKAN
jgi:hypothetical protein